MNILESIFGTTLKRDLIEKEPEIISYDIGNIMFSITIAMVSFIVFIFLIAVIPSFTDLLEERFEGVTDEFIQNNKV